MRKKIQGFISGVLAGIIITSGVVFAANTTTLYDVMMNGIEIIVDGQRLNPKDVNGKRVEPFIYNGTTYLPVRAVADALGKEVYWDGPNYTVYLGDMDGQLEYPSVELEDMVSVGDKPNQTKHLTDNYGNRYERAINNDYYGYRFEYLLNMKYSRFKGTLYVPEGEKNDNGVYLKIIADGKTIYTSPEMTKTSAPVNIDVNVTGYNDVKIEFSDREGSGNHYIECCLGDAGFYQ